MRNMKGVCQADKGGKGVSGRGNNICEDPKWEHTFMFREGQGLW